jgi:hypothetical protein
LLPVKNFLFLLARIRHDYDHLGVITLAAAVHAAQPLYHPLPGDEITDHVVGVEVHPNLCSEGREKDHRVSALQPRACEKSEFFQALFRGLTLEDPSTADEKLRLSEDSGIALPGFLGKPLELLLGVLRHFPTVAEHKDTHWLLTVGAQIPGLSGQGMGQVIVLAECQDAQSLSRAQASANNPMLAITLCQSHRTGW